MFGTRMIGSAAKNSIVCRCRCRSFATAAPGNVMPYKVFNRKLKQLQRDRAALHPRADDVHYLRDEIARRLVDRLYFIKRSFDTVVDLGAGEGNLARAIVQDRPEEPEKLYDRIKLLIEGDLSEQKLIKSHSRPTSMNIERRFIDEELLPFNENSISAFLSNLNFHWINDLPGALAGMQKALVPDGLLMASMFGGDTLFELRTSLQLAEQERHGGISARVSPMAESRDIGSLLNRAGFKLTTIDVEDIIVDYPDMWALMHDLQAMGENNAVLAKHHVLPRDIMAAAQAIYKELHGNPDGTIPATFHIIFMVAWKPAPGQQQPLERGSGEKSMKNMLSDLGGTKK